MPRRGVGGRETRAGPGGAARRADLDLAADVFGNRQPILTAAFHQRHAEHFAKQRYCGVDLAVGDARWNCRGLDAVAGLTRLPFHGGCFDACVNIVTLEHVANPQRAIEEMSRVPGRCGRRLLIVPRE
jgi:SAM-dependent methyltransferase